MNEFENKLIIKDEAYQNGFFPKVPEAGKRGSAYLLTGGCKDDIVIDERTVPKQIRKGKYTRTAIRCGNEKKCQKFDGSILYRL